MPFLVHSADIKDVEALASLEAACFPDAWSAEAIASHMTSPGSLTVIAEEIGGGAIGYVFGRWAADEGELYRVAVLPEHRLVGVGWNLVDSFLFKLKIEGVRSCYLEVRESNLGARILYENHGFTICGKRKNYYKNPTEDALLMALHSL